MRFYVVNFDVLKCKLYHKMIYFTEKSKKALLRAKIKELIIITVLYPVNKCRFDVLLLL